MRILVTGATGFIGSAVVDACAAAGVPLHVTYRENPPSSSAGVTAHEVDLFDANAVRRLVSEVRPTHLVALAWYMRRRDHLTTPENLAWVGSTLAAMDAFVESGGKRAIFGGTYAEYGVREGVCREEDLAEPVSLYAVCKDALRRIVLEYALRAGVEAVWTRMFTVYGPRDAPYRVIPYAIETLLDGGIVEATAGTQVRDFVHVSDVAAALVTLLDSPVTGIVNVGSGKGHSVAAVLEEIARRLGAPERLKLGAREQAAGETQSIVADVGRLRATGWKPHFSLESGIADAIAYYERRKG